MYGDSYRDFRQKRHWMSLWSCDRLRQPMAVRQNLRGSSAVAMTLYFDVSVVTLLRLAFTAYNFYWNALNKNMVYVSTWKFGCANLVQKNIEVWHVFEHQFLYQNMSIIKQLYFAQTWSAHELTQWKCRLWKHLNAWSFSLAHFSSETEGCSLERINMECGRPVCKGSVLKLFVHAVIFWHI